MSEILNLSHEAIHLANSNSQFDAGSAIARDAERVYLAGLKTFEPCTDWNDQQREYMHRRAEGWRELCQKSFNDQLRRRASWVPWTVAGPANYNYKRNNSAADADLKATAEWSEKRKAYLANSLETVRELVPVSVKIERYRTGKDDRPISADDPAAVEKLSARIECLKEEHARNLMLTKHYKKHKTMKGAPGVSDEQAAKLDAKLETLPECMRGFGFPSNETATIRRLEKRLQDLESMKQAEKESAATEHAGFIVKQNAEINRLQILFNDKPSEGTRNILKANGFKWSPREGAWQRQLTENALSALNRIIKDIESE